MRRVLVTGGTGFVGQRLVRALSAQGILCRVVVHNRQPAELEELDLRLIDLVQADVTDPGSLVGLAEGVDTVYNLAAVGHVSALSVEAEQTFFRVNVDGVENLARACACYPLDRFVHLSSTAAVGTIRAQPIDEQAEPQPRTLYQQSKWQGERALNRVKAEAGLPIVILRPCMIYGLGGKGEFLKFCRLISKGLFPRAGLSDILVPIVYVDDVVLAAVLAGERGRLGETYFVASERSVKMVEIHKLVTQALGIWRPYWYTPIWALLMAAYLVEGYARLRCSTPFVTRANIRSMTASRVFSIAKAKRELGYTPQIPLEKGILQTVEWYRSQGLL